GIEKVYEIGRIFRNEGADATHNPEFTMLEAYEAYGDYTTMATLTRELIQGAARAAFGGTVVRRPDGSEYDIGGDWPSTTGHDAVSGARGGQIKPGLGPGQGPGGHVLAPGRATALRAGLLPGFPRRGRAADQGAPGRPEARREVGPGRVRYRDRDRILRAGRPRRGAQPADRAVAARRGRRPGGHAAG